MRDVFDVNHGQCVACRRIAVPLHAPEWQPLTAQGGATNVRANYVTHHTRALSYVAQKIGQTVPRFVHILLDDDGCVWSR